MNCLRRRRLHSGRRSGRRQEWLDTEGLEAQVILAETMLRALPDILTGQRPATDVMFPNSSMHLVEGIYKNNPHADYFNGVLAGTAVAYVEQRIRHNPSAKIRILEIGAGTGGTSSGVLRKLEPYRDRIQEYAYTDLTGVSSACREGIRPALSLSGLWHL